MSNVCDAPHRFVFPAIYERSGIKRIVERLSYSYSVEFLIGERQHFEASRRKILAWKKNTKRPNRAAHDYVHYDMAWMAIISIDNTRYYPEPRNTYVRIRQVCISLRWAKSRISRLQVVVARSDITRGINRLARQLTPSISLTFRRESNTIL